MRTDLIRFFDASKKQKNCYWIYEDWTRFWGSVTVWGQLSHVNIILCFTKFSFDNSHEDRTTLNETSKATSLVYNHKLLINEFEHLLTELVDCFIFTMNIEIAENFWLLNWNEFPKGFLLTLMISSSNDRILYVNLENFCNIDQNITCLPTHTSRRKQQVSLAYFPLDMSWIDSTRIVHKFQLKSVYSSD